MLVSSSRSAPEERCASTRTSTLQAAEVEHAHESPDPGNFVFQSEGHNEKASNVVLATLMVDCLLVKPEQEECILHANAFIGVLKLCNGSGTEAGATGPLRTWLSTLNARFAQNKRPITFAQHQLLRNLMSATQSPTKTETTPLPWGENRALLETNKMYACGSNIIQEMIGSHEGEVVQSAARILDVLSKGQQTLDKICADEQPSVRLDNLHKGNEAFVNWLAARFVAASMENMQLAEGAYFAHSAFASKVPNDEGAPEPPPHLYEDGSVPLDSFGACFMTNHFNSSQDKGAVEHAFRAISILLLASECGLERLSFEAAPTLRAKAKEYHGKLYEKFQSLFECWKRRYTQETDGRNLHSALLLSELHGIATTLLQDARQTAEAAATLQAILLGRVFCCGIEHVANGSSYRCGSMLFGHAYKQFVVSNDIDGRSSRDLCLLEAMELLVGAASALGSPARPQDVLSSIWAGVLAECSESSKKSVHLCRRGGSISHEYTGPIILARTVAASIQSQYFDSTGKNAHRVSLTHILGRKGKAAGAGRRGGSLALTKETRVNGSWHSGVYHKSTECGPSSVRTASMLVVGFYHLALREGMLRGGDMAPSQNSSSFDNLLAEEAQSYPGTYFFSKRRFGPLNAIAMAIGPLRAIFHCADHQELHGIYMERLAEIEPKMQEKQRATQNDSSESVRPVSMKSSDFAARIAAAMERFADSLFNVDVTNSHISAWYDEASVASFKKEELRSDYESARGYAKKWAALLAANSSLAVAIDDLNSFNGRSGVLGKRKTLASTSSGTPRSERNLEAEIQEESDDE